MATGLIALLDDVAALAKLAAASVDDVAAAAGRAGAKAAGVVIDDAAVTPRYVTGLAASRELPIIGRITLGSLRNKLLLLLPAALLLSAFAPWAITPLLMLGGAFLSYEGAEKVLHALLPHGVAAHEAAARTVPATPEALEETQVRSAIQTDLILSAEIMAITLASLPPAHWAMQAAILALVGIGITLGVYGTVALIVKADDAGMALARRGGPVLGRIGRGLVKAMPVLLDLLGAIGSVAMLWVGGSIVLHGLESFGVAAPAHGLHSLAAAAAHSVPGWLGSTVEWLVTAAGSAVAGLLLGAVLMPVVSRVIAPLVRAMRGKPHGTAHP